MLFCYCQLCLDNNGVLWTLTRVTSARCTPGHGPGTLSRWHATIWLWRDTKVGFTCITVYVSECATCLVTRHTTCDSRQSKRGRVNHYTVTCLVRWWWVFGATRVFATNQSQSWNIKYLQYRQKKQQLHTDVMWTYFNHLNQVTHSVYVSCIK